MVQHKNSIITDTKNGIDSNNQEDVLKNISDFQMRCVNIGYGLALMDEYVKKFTESIQTFSTGLEEDTNLSTSFAQIIAILMAIYGYYEKTKGDMKASLAKGGTVPPLKLFNYTYSDGTGIISVMNVESFSDGKNPDNVYVFQKKYPSNDPIIDIIIHDYIKSERIEILESNKW